MTKNQIITALFTGKNFNDCLAKMEPDHLREDLRQEVILVICELSDERIYQLNKDGALEFFTVRVILNQIKSKTSPFYKKYRNTILCYVDDVTDMAEGRNINTGLTTNNETFIEEKEERRLREEIEDIALSEIDSLHWYNKGLIELYMRHGNFRAIEAETGIPLSSCYKTIKKSLKQIKYRVKGEDKLVFTKAELSYIQNNSVKCSLTK